MTTRFSAAGNNGSNSAFAAWVMKPWGSAAPRSQQEIQQDIQPRLDKIAGFRPSCSRSRRCRAPAAACRSPSSSNRPVGRRVYEQAEAIKGKAFGSGKFIVVQDSLSFDTPQVRVLIDRQRAAALGVSIADIGNTLTLLVGENAQVRPRFARLRHHPAGAAALPLQSGGPRRLLRAELAGAMVPLSSVVSIETQRLGAGDRAVQPAQLGDPVRPAAAGRDHRRRARHAPADRRGAAAQGLFVQYAGQSRTEIAAGNTLLLAFGLAIIVIYLVLAAQFESFRDPLIIMMAVPLSSSARWCRSTWA